MFLRVNRTPGFAGVAAAGYSGAQHVVWRRPNQHKMLL